MGGRHELLGRWAPGRQGKAYPSEEGNVDERRVGIGELKCEQLDDEGVIVSRLCSVVFWKNCERLY